MANLNTDNLDSQELDPGQLDTDAVLVRSLKEADLDAVVRIDRQATGRSRTAYYSTKLQEATDRATLNTSLVAEIDDHVVGFAIARLYYGEFGVSEPVALIDSLGVDQGFRRQHIGDALMRQLIMNLRAVNVEYVETLLDWDRHDLAQFLGHHDFKPVPRLCLRLNLND